MNIRILSGDCVGSLRKLPDESVHCCMTSPPYWGLRDYGVAGQLGMEKTPLEYVDRMVAVFREVRRVLRDDGTLWLNLGDSYANGKQLTGIPWRVAFALQADGWYLRQDIIWHKPNPMPESVQDRCTKSHEYVFLLAKSPRYWFDHEAIKEPAKNPGLIRRTTEKSFSYAQAIANGKPPSGDGVLGSVIVVGDKRHRRSVWSIATKPYKGAHFAVFPPALAETCILAGSPSQTCAACGRGYERIVDRTRIATRPNADTWVSKITGDRLVDGNRDNKRHITTTETVGFKLSCVCRSPDIGAAVVLDPFGGSGTTAAVAVEHGRSAVLCELNPDYIELAKHRIQGIYEKRPILGSPQIIVERGDV